MNDGPRMQALLHFLTLAGRQPTPEALQGLDRYRNSQPLILLTRVFDEVLALAARPSALELGLACFAHCVIGRGDMAATSRLLIAKFGSLGKQACRVLWGLTLHGPDGERIA